MLFIRIRQDDKIRFEEWFEGGGKPMIAPLFEGETYEIEVYGKGGKLVKREETIAKKEGVFLVLPKGKVETKVLNKADIRKFIEQLIKERFDKDLKEQISLIKSMYPDAKLNEGQMRGGRLEQLMYFYLQKLEIERIVDSVTWSGKVGDYGLAYPASGEPDILVCFNDFIIVLEVTVIGNTRMQWSAEGASVPDHIKQIKLKNPDKKVCGLFSTPSIHHQLKKNLDRHAEVDKLPMLCMVLPDVLNLFSVSSRVELKNILLEHCKKQLPSFS